MGADEVERIGVEAWEGEELTTTTHSAMVAMATRRWQLVSTTMRLVDLAERRVTGLIMVVGEATVLATENLAMETLATEDN